MLSAIFFVHYTVLGGSVAEWLACWTQAQKGLGSHRSGDLGKLLTPIVPVFTKQRHWYRPTAWEGNCRPGGK